MRLNIRDPRAHELAQCLAKRRGVSMTVAVIDALQSQLERTPAQAPLADRLQAIANNLAAMAKPDGHDMTKEEIDDMWGQP